MDFRQKNKDKKLLLALYAKSSQHQNLKQKVVQLLPHNLSILLDEAHYLSGVLTLYFSKQIALNQCRFILPQLSRQLKKESAFQTLKKIQLSIANNSSNKQVKDLSNKDINEASKKLSRNPNLLFSDRSAKMLESLADSTKNIGLKESLMRLAKDMEEKKDS